MDAFPMIARCAELQDRRLRQVTIVRCAACGRLMVNFGDEWCEWCRMRRGT